jgi:hypothetical protein
MFTEMSCKCGAMIQLDGFNDSFTEFTTIRFLDAHIGCGFVTPVKKEMPDRTIRKELDIRQIVPQDDDED